MKIKFLGTAAAESVPAISCHCDVCKYARNAGGRNIRSRSQALVNDDLLIDFNADTLWHVVANNIDMGRINDCLITHSHGDHLYTEEICNYRPDFCHGRTVPMTFYAGQSGYDKISTVANADYMRGAVQAVLVGVGDVFTVCGGKYTVTAMQADHDQSSSPLLYSVADGTKRMLYGHDTGYFPDATWQTLATLGRHDLVTLDCTGCLALGGDCVSYHMSFGTVLKVVARMKQIGVADDGTTVIVNHFSHNGGQAYDQMIDACKTYGVIVSYDGMEIDF